MFEAILATFWLIPVLAVGCLYAYRAGMIEIGGDEVGLVFKKHNLFSLTRVPPATRQSKEDNFPSSNPAPLANLQFALEGEAGWQADVLSPGTHLGYWRWMYKIQKVVRVHVPPGQVGLVVANDGAPLPVDRRLGRIVECNGFQDARSFLVNGGQMGQQFGLLTTGTYRINTKLFDVYVQEDLRVCVIKTGNVGIVSTLEGSAIPAGDTAGPVIPGHDCFQNGQRFVDAGGCKGIQEEVLQAGSYTLNRWFVLVEQVPLTYIPTGTVGVVISNAGKAPRKDARVELVEEGYKGVRRTPLPPGWHALNPRVLKVEIVPTYEITLDWSNKSKDRRNYDAPLRKLRLRSNDGYEFDIEVTQIIHIKAEDAPRMILRVGSPGARAGQHDTADVPSNTEKFDSIRNLVMRVLEPMVGNYFRNTAQDYGVLDFLKNRGERQREAMDRIKAALGIYGVQAVGTFINDIDLPPDIENTLRKRTLAEEMKKTLIVQRETEQERGRLVKENAEMSGEVDVIKARAEADVFLIKSGAKDVARREKELVKFEVMQKVVEVLGQEGYLRKEHIDQIPNLKLPTTIMGSNGVFDTFLAQYLGNAASPQHPPDQDNLKLIFQIVDDLKRNPAKIDVLMDKLTDRPRATQVTTVNANPVQPPLSLESRPKNLGS